MIFEDNLITQVFLIFLAFASGGINYLRTIFEKKVEIFDSDDAEEIEEKAEKIRKQKNEKRTALILFVLLLTASLVNAAVSYRKEEQKKSTDERAKSETRKAALFKQQVDLAFSRVAEASGGVALGDYVYLVDDDKPKLFRAKYDPEKGKYD